eukprot:2233798-Pyramimonas_sp.AAC.3
MERNSRRSNRLDLREKSLGRLPSDGNPIVGGCEMFRNREFRKLTVADVFGARWVGSCPAAIYMTRGNHESKNMNKIYGFEGEVKSKYNEPMVNLFTE